MSNGESQFSTLSHWGAYTVTVRGGQVVAIAPFVKDPDPSPIIESLPSALHDKSRILHPMVRKGFLEDRQASDRTKRGADPFVAVSWDEALDLVAEELDRVQSTHGNEAIYGSSGWSSAGQFHHAESQLKRFLNASGGFVDQVTNFSFGAASVIVPRVTGSMEPVLMPTMWPVIVENTRLMVLFGGLPQKNSQVTKDGLGAHSMMEWLRKAKAAGVEFVSISPRRGDMPDFLEAEWLPARPNTDVALMLGLAHTLVAEGLHDSQFLDRYCVGFERFLPYLTGQVDGVPKDAEWAATITEIGADTIRELARRMVATRCMVAASWSVQRSDHGEQPFWMAVALAAMLGQIGLPGGGFGFGYGAMNSIGDAVSRIPVPSLPRGRNSVQAFIPVARVADMLLNPGGQIDFNGQKITYPDIRLIYWCGGNPFHKQQDINRLLRAWQEPETIIIHEPWWTPTARRADIVLPCTTTLERNDIGASASDRFFVAMHKAIEPIGESRSDYDIFSGLSRRLGCHERYTEGRDEMGWLRHIYDVARQGASRAGHELLSFDEFWEKGHLEFPASKDPKVLFDAFRGDPGGSPLKTPSGKIEIYSETIAGFEYDDCPGHPMWMEPIEWLGSQKTDSFPLHLISNAPAHRLHSQLDCGAVSRGAKVGGREPVWMHPRDAEARAIGDGDIVRVFNGRGACLAGAVVTDSIRPGVIQLATGAWYDPMEPGNIGSLDKHGNPNVLTLDKGASKLTQTCAALSALVEIEPFGGEPPPVSAFEPPS
jgi:biotin/methionine sulfoxide reductase